MTLRAVAFNCSLKPSLAESSLDQMLDILSSALADHGVQTEVVRVVDHDVRPGVDLDMGGGDAWPALRDKVLQADIFILGSPIWLGQPSSVSRRVAERFDAEVALLDEKGRMPTFGTVAMAAVVGNEDGAHHVAAESFGWLNEVGFTVPSTGAVYWVGEALGKVDFKDLPEIPEKVQSMVETAAASAAHLAALLKGSPYPGVVS